MIYFLACLELGRVKIGYSGNVDDRLVRIRDGSPTELHHILTVPGTRSIEKRLHRHFSKHRLHGEWFLAAPPIIALCDALLGRTEEEQAATITALWPAKCRMKFDAAAERGALLNCTKRFIEKHGRHATLRLTGSSVQSINNWLRGERLVTSSTMTKMMAHDPEPFEPFFGCKFERLEMAA